MTFLQKHHGQMSDSMLTAFFIILSGGLQDAYTYLCRGKVFANAQTGNIVLFSAYLFDGDWAHSRRYLVPVLSFMLGIFVAECIHRHFKHCSKYGGRVRARVCPHFAITAYRSFILYYALIYKALTSDTSAINDCHISY